MAKSRERKYRQLISLTKPSKDSTILDVGVADKEYSPFDNYFEKRYPYPDRITALSIHPLEEFSKRYRSIKAISYSGGEFPFEDKQFSLVVSNAVIEHVGGFRAQVLFIKELQRVGNQFFFTTPAKEFPIEIHTNLPFIHWLSEKKFDKVLKWLRKGWCSGDYMNLLTKKQIKYCMNVAEIQKFQILTHRIAFIPVHYAVWGR